MWFYESHWVTLRFRALTGPASTNSSEKLRPGLRSSKLNNCLKQEAAENYKAAITYSDNVSAVEVWADSWWLGMWQLWKRPALAHGWSSSQLNWNKVQTMGPCPDPFDICEQGHPLRKVFSWLCFCCSSKTNISYFVTFSPPNLKFTSMYVDLQQQVDWSCVIQKAVLALSY